ncbi:LytTR family DNA-binding domain-containing protein [Aquimarina litoralis]|uniref:LytTR family DNA-binding domain-containing protein n=1 Tax=Aquimarina litoralis TaxID=584605 RepID=UPI001C56CEDF|nr:LytTR family DNA-binding domain-containing protein [Aquimarina litoralis]MBW1297350.1 LytTR family transcriptional regulator [Aquimarina litoralis]
MNIRFPFDPSIKHHLLIALGLAIWIFIFLYFTEPLDVNEFGPSEKLIYLPFYGIVGAICYISLLPIQQVLFKKNNDHWSLLQEIIFLSLFIILGLILSRSFYLYVVMHDEQNPYTLWYHLKRIYVPAVITILPIVIIGRWSFGKYKNKKLEDQKIEIKGAGNYESLRLFFNQILCIQSSDNYIEISYLDADQIKKQLIRNKLSSIASDFPELLQTHRSFLINPFHFKQWKTEKGKIGLLLTHHIEIPISKTYLPKVKDQLNSTTK